jgi:hypothetical protein
LFPCGRQCVCNVTGGHADYSLLLAGDFKEVFGGLADSARATRSDLSATVDLYTKMAPALQGIGMSGKAAISVLTTINQAVGLSGVSATSAASRMACSTFSLLASMNIFNM